ncbi:MAG: hypothetical protein JSW59_17020 [Phycisphaerales bacterium]|nr:MAG: hypothetical protein JSW59_17020 [Phycisphaerales bacterium]
MAGMFYSLQEALERLSMTEEQIKQVVADGKLREFRDGPNLLFKVEEVEALVPQAGDEALEEALEPEAPEAEESELIALEAEDLEPAELEDVEPAAIEPEAVEPEEAEPVVLEPEDLEPEATELEAVEPEPAAEPEPSAEEPAEAALSDFDIEALGDTAAEIPDAEALEAEMADTGAAEPAPSDQAVDTDEILLAPETGAAIPSDLTDADTAITSMGTNVLGESDAGYDITDDTMAETAVPAGSGPEVPLEEIEEDVNLDSFGSGSGLLDLSLQADDTSLGGILDEIYTAEEEGAEPAEGAVEALAEPDMAREAEEMGAEEELEAPQLAAQVPALARPLIETPPDAQSNTLGMLLFLPLVIVIYTTVVALSAMKGVMPSILDPIQGKIWYIMGLAAFVALAVAVAAFMFMGERDTTAKAAKPKREKKAKKAKEPKKPKAEKPKKEKKAKKKKK